MTPLNWGIYPDLIATCFPASKNFKPLFNFFNSFTMKTFFAKALLLLGVVLLSYSTVHTQVFIMQAVFDEFYVEGDVVLKMQQAGYRKTSVSELPDDISTPIKNLTNYLDEQVGKVKKIYYINENDGSILLCGIESEAAYFSYAVNFFSGNTYAVDRIREVFTENDLIFDHELNGIYYYFDGEEAGGIVGILDNGIVMVGYFEP